MSEFVEFTNRAEAILRDLCIHGWTNVRSCQDVVDSCLLPNVEWILARTQTNDFSNGNLSASVVGWALEKKCYPLLRYLILNGWDVNSDLSPTPRLCPGSLGFVSFPC